MSRLISSAVFSLVSPTRRSQYSRPPVSIFTFDETVSIQGILEMSSRQLNFIQKQDTMFSFETFLNYSLDVGSTVVLSPPSFFVLTSVRIEDSACVIVEGHAPVSPCPLSLMATIKTVGRFKQIILDVEQNIVPGVLQVRLSGVINPTSQARIISQYGTFAISTFSKESYPYPLETGSMDYAVTLFTARDVLQPKMEVGSKIVNWAASPVTFTFANLCPMVVGDHYAISFPDGFVVTSGNLPVVTIKQGSVVYAFDDVSVRTPSLNLTLSGDQFMDLDVSETMGQFVTVITISNGVINPPYARPYSQFEFISYVIPYSHLAPARAFVYTYSNSALTPIVPHGTFNRYNIYGYVSSMAARQLNYVSGQDSMFTIQFSLYSTIPVGGTVVFTIPSWFVLDEIIGAVSIVDSYPCFNNMQAAESCSISDNITVRGNKIFMIISNALDGNTQYQARFRGIMNPTIGRSSVTYTSGEVVVSSYPDATRSYLLDTGSLSDYKSTVIYSLSQVVRPKISMASNRNMQYATPLNISFVNLIPLYPGDYIEVHIPSRFNVSVVPPPVVGITQSQLRPSLASDEDMEPNAYIWQSVIVTDKPETNSTVIRMSLRDEILIQDSATQQTIMTFYNRIINPYFVGNYSFNLYAYAQPFNGLQVVPAYSYSKFDSTISNAKLDDTTIFYNNEDVSMIVSLQVGSPAGATITESAIIQLINELSSSIDANIGRFIYNSLVRGQTNEYPSSMNIISELQSTTGFRTLEAKSVSSSAVSTESVAITSYVIRFTIQADASGIGPLAVELYNKLLLGLADSASETSQILERSSLRFFMIEAHGSNESSSENGSILSPSIASSSTIVPSTTIVAMMIAVVFVFLSWIKSSYDYQL